MGNHRAERSAPTSASRQAPAAPYAAAGKRSAGRRKAAPASRKTSPLGTRQTSFPAVPTVIGAVALTVAGAGAIGIGGSSTINLSSGGAGIYAATNAGPQADDRTRAISRDSDRQALQDAAAMKLKQAAEKQTKQRNAALAALAKDAESRADEIEKNLWVLPVQGYHLTARFGAGGGLWSRNHTGLDFAAPSGTPIHAVANAVVTETGYDGSYGNKTVLTLADGTEVWFCHQTSIGVNVGDTVTAGQQIGTVGSTGNSTGPHLHLEVRPGGGDPVDPFSALIFHGLNP